MGRGLGERARQRQSRQDGAARRQSDELSTFKLHGNKPPASTPPRIAAARHARQPTGCLCGWRGPDRLSRSYCNRETKMLPSQRDLFEMPRHICYLNSASYSPLPLRTLDAGRAAVGRKGTPWTLDAGFVNRQHERARAAAGQMINAAPADTALIASIVYGVAEA